MRKMSKLKKGSILAVIIVLFLLLFFWWYDSVYLIQESSIPNEIQEKIHSLNEIDFSKLVDGDWDTLTIISSYTDQKEIQENFNININRLADKSVEYHDGQNLFVFCKKGKVESYFYIPDILADVDYTRLPKTQTVLRNEAIFSPVENKTTQNIELQFSPL